MDTAPGAARAGQAGGQSALFVSRLVDLSLKPYTAFPEKIDLLENGRMILARNSFGWFRIPVAGGLPSPFEGRPSFAEDGALASNAVEDADVSPDGKWIVALESVSAAYSDLVLVNIASGERTPIASPVEKSGGRFPARWSPNSQFFIYEKGGSLYYYQIGAAAPLNERYRLIGEGSIACAVWEDEGDFYYIKGSSVYRIRGSEILFRSMYRDFLEMGYSAGTLPFTFDPDFDEFYVAPDARSLLISKSGRTLFFYPLSGSYKAALPYLQLPDDCLGTEVIWSDANIITVLFKNGFSDNGGVRTNETNACAYRLDAAGALLQKGGSAAPGFVAVDAPAGMDEAALSPDGGTVLLWGDAGVVLYDYAAWKKTYLVSETPALDCLWVSYNMFIAGDEKRVERINIDDDGLRRALVCLSSVERFAFETDTNRILAQNNEEWFVTDGRLAWNRIENPAIRPTSVVSGRYRVYLEPQPSGHYENIPMIRNIAGVGTSPLLRHLPPPDEGKKIALCFDLYDDTTGLNHTLEALDFFGIKATFFLNGEAIRQHPAAALRIAAAGHEAASLFFAPLDLSTTRYTIDKDFVSKGLARNEDEFFSASGSELKLLWHPPFYVSVPEIAAFAEELGYKTVNRTVDPGDTVSKDEAARSGVPFRSVPAMIDYIMSRAQNGAIIPVRLGLLPAGRGDYLYNRIFVLIDALVGAGYSLVPVSALMESPSISAPLP